MIVIKNNRIIFGHGTILVTSTFSILELWHINPSTVIGEQITRDFKESVIVVRKQSFRDLYRLKEKLNNVTD